MKLSRSEGRPIKDVTPEQLNEAAVGMSYGSGNFLVLEAGGDYFMQALLDDDHNFHMEYREGSSAHHYRSVTSCTPRQMIDLFLSYLARDLHWRTMIAWERHPDFR